ncbi:MAG: hypothetical protein K2L38_01310 [Dysosmobacter sp.]|nr:hypothetical protein [Dysosmobacter sp.]
MQIKHDKEKDYADFTVAQSTSVGGQAMVRFIETWSGMMECVINEGASDVTEAAALTVQAAADAAGITRDEEVVAGAARLLDCWAHGDQLREWFVYHPPEILSGTPNAALNLFYASQELRDAVPKLVDAYPCILKTASNLLEVHQLAAQTPSEAAAPTMSM